MGGKRNSFLVNWLLFAFIMCLAVGISTPVFAQDDEGDEFTLEEITVTAEKREAELQKIPIDIAVVRPDDMSRLGVYTLEELDEMLPEVTADEAGAGNTISVTIRNVTTNFWNTFHETTVAIHMDGIQLTRPNGMNDMFFDLQRVEVLKGPQGTLYGRGSTAGSMNIISQKPILNQFGGHFTSEIGNYDRYRFEGALNIPVTEKFAIRFAGRSMKQDGLNDNNYGNRDQWGGRINFNWEPTDTQQITASYHFEAHEELGYGNSGFGYGTYGDFRIVPNPNPIYAGHPVMDIGVRREIKLPWQSQWYYGNSRDWQFNDNNGWGAMIQYDHELPWALLTALYGHVVNKEWRSWTISLAGVFQGFFGRFSENWDPTVGTCGFWWTTGGAPAVCDSVYVQTGATFADIGWELLSENVSHFDSVEVRLLSKETITQGDKYEWVVGTMYSSDDITSVDAHRFNPSWTRVQNYNKSVFAQASYSLFSSLNLTAGWRFSNDNKKWSGSGKSDTWDQNQPGFEMDYVAHNWRKNDYKATLSWVVTDDIMSYFTWSKGTKNGNLDFEGQAIPPEVLKSMEVGFRSTWFNNKLRFNANAYYYEYKNYNQWTRIEECFAYNVYDPADGVSVTVDPATGYAITTTDINATNALDLSYAHECADVASSDNFDSWDDNDNGIIDPDEMPQSPTLGGPVPGWVPGDPDFNVTGSDLERAFSVGVSPGGSEQLGVNVDWTWMVTRKDTLSARATWSTNEYADYNLFNAILASFPEADNPYTDPNIWNPTDGALNRDGEKFSGITPIRGNINYSHVEYIGMDTMMFNLNANYTGTQDDILYDRGYPEEAWMPGRDEYWILNASLSYRSNKWVPEGMRWNVRFQVNNLMDSDFVSSINYRTNRSWQNSTNGWYSFVPNGGTYSMAFVQPRTYSLTFTLSF